MTDTTTNTVLNSLNRLNEAKQSGALKSDELSKIVILAGSLFSNLVTRGEKTEEDVENFEKEIPNGKYNPFSFNHNNLDVAYDTVKQSNTAALYERENRYGQFQQIKKM